LFFAHKTDVLLGTIMVVFPATTQILFLVVYRLPAATVAPLLKDFVCKKQYLVSDTISSNKFGKLHLAVHSFSIEKFTLVFFKLKTLVLVGFVLGNGENCSTP
jgi:hypothetical protein